MGMAEALAETDRIADVLTDPNPHPELSAYAPLTESVWLRGRFDLLGGSLWDYKTTAASADPDIRSHRLALWLPHSGLHVPVAA